MERLIPDEVQPNDTTGQKSLELHMQRYKFASEHLKPGRLLDIACGVGYGTRLMIDSNPRVVEAVGVDIDLGSIQYAQSHYGDNRIRFIHGDGMVLEDEKGFDSIVSIETLEHLHDPEGFLNRHFLLAI